ncbi:hypothetical protein ACVMGF_004229 [Bradyrhizobium diazoefficiens]
MSASMRFCTASATFTSLAPLERLMPSATTGSPLKRAKVRRSAMVSVTVPRSSSRTSPPPNSGTMVPARSLSVLAPARVRIAWSFLPISARPPATSTLVPRRLWLTLTAVRPIA